MLVGGADKAWPRMPLAIFSAERASRTHYNRRGDPSCDLEPISWEYAPVKHHDTGVLLAWLVTVAIVSPSGGHQSVLALVARRRFISGLIRAARNLAR